MRAEDRYLLEGIRELCFESHKIALLSGPRQVGKTTLAQTELARRPGGRYWNWDDRAARALWTRSPQDLWPERPAGPPREAVPTLVLDEVHKARDWKQTVKGLFDTRPFVMDMLVTGSARLNVYRKGGTSLLGRAFHFRLHPFSVAELAALRLPSQPDRRLAALAGRSLAPPPASIFDALLQFGGFPEPFLTARDRHARVWRRGRVETIIREDLRDLSRLPELSRVEMLAAMLPTRVASPLSRASLREDLEVSFDTVSRWLAALENLYYSFEIRPHARNVTRSLKREGKLYLWDWSEVDAPGPRFENLVAGHLLKAVDAWTDTGHGTFELRYLRNKEKQEVDFLVVRDGKPWLPVEAKLSALEVEHLPRFMRQLGSRIGLQLVATPGVWREHRLETGTVIVASAAEALAYLV